jgi:uncharacterized protein
MGNAVGPTDRLPKVTRDVADVTSSLEVTDGPARPAFLDHHCHPLIADWTHVSGKQPGWRRCFTEGHTDVPSLIGYRRFRAALAALLGCSAEEHALTRHRDQRIAADPAGYLRLLADDAGISAWCVDIGYPRGSIDRSVLVESTARPAYLIVRLETLLEQELAAGVEGIADRFEARLEEQVKEGAVAFKSIAAYRSGLDLPTPTAGAVRLAAADPDQAVRVTDEALVALAVQLGMAVAGRHDLPVQFHTGFGDPDLFLPAADPALLTPMLRTANCPVVLLHGWPYLRQAAYLASVYPNVYADLSLTLPVLEPVADRLLAEVLSACPVTRVLAASDGHSYPEMYWWGAVVWRRALAKLEDDDLLEPADTAAILGGTSRSLYSLDTGADVVL